MRFFALFIIAASALMGGCATNPFITQEGTSTGYRFAQLPQTVVLGNVVSVRDAKLVNQPSGLGERTGALLGGLLGLSAAHSRTDREPILALAGGIGAFIGMEAGKQLSSNVAAQELVIRTDAGAVLSVVQSSADGVRFKGGQRVMLLGGGRVAPVLQ